MLSLSWCVLCYVVPSVMYIVVHAFVYTEQSLLMLSLQLWFLNNALADRRMYRSYYIFSFFFLCVLLSSVFFVVWYRRDHVSLSLAPPWQSLFSVVFLSHFVRFQFSHTFAGIKTSSMLQPIHLIQQFLIH